NKLGKHELHHKLKREREIRGWSRAYVAEHIGVEVKTVSRWERGEATPQSRYHYDLVKLFGVSAAKLGLVEEEDPLSSPQSISSSPQPSVAEPITQGTRPLQDWGEAPHIEACYGRQQECETLTHWILNEHCRMIAVLGIGGIGKTTFTTM